MELVVSDLAGTARKVLVTGINLGNFAFNDAQIAWSPDDDRLVFTGVIDSKAGLFLVNTDGSGLTFLRGGGFSPDWR